MTGPAWAAESGLTLSQGGFFKADLQAETCVRNLMADITGQPQTHTFRTALICIIDSLDSGGLVFRNERRNSQFRASPFHWGKSRFEKRYLKPHRGVA